MKKLLFVLVAIFLLLSGCSLHQSNDRSNGNFVDVELYYELASTEQQHGDTVIFSENRSINVYTLEELLDIYFKGPTTISLESPFPAGTKVKEITQEEGVTRVVLSGEFFTLSSVDMSIACCCFANTVCSYLQTDSVMIADEFNRIQTTLCPDDYSLNCTLNADTDSLFTLYFADENNRYLIPETRSVTLSDNESPVEYLIHELAQGPQNQSCYPILKNGVSISDVTVDNNLCIVNFNSEVLSLDEDSYAAYMLIFGIVNTITGVDGISYVQFRVEGQELIKLGPLQLTAPIGYYAEAIGPVNSSAGQIDVNLSVLDAGENNSFLIPVCIKQSVMTPLAESVARTAVSFEPPGGMVNPIPYGTEVLSISVSGNVCYLDVNAKAIPINDDVLSEKKIIWSLISPLIALDNIDSVLLTIEGESSGFKYIDISEPFTAKDVDYY